MEEEPSAALPQLDLKYDPAKQQFIDDEDANKLLARVIRKPWSLA